MRKTSALLRAVTGIILFLSPVHSSAQSDTAYYFFDDGFDISGDTSAPNAGIAIKEDSVWRLVVVNMSTQKIVMKGHYLAINLQREDGLFEYYFADGVHKLRGYYNDGVRVGLWKGWNSNNRLIDSVFFENGSPVMSTRYAYDENDLLLGFTYNDNATKKKVSKNYNPNGAISSESEFIGKAGEIKRYYDNGKPSEILVFDAQGKKTARHFSEDGTEISEKAYAKEQEKKGNELMAAIRATQPEFKGGRFQFEVFLQRTLRLPSNFTTTYHNLQSIQFSFTLNEKGKAENLKLINPVDVELERSLLELLRVMPPWDMKGLKSYGPILQTINITAH